MFVAAYGLMFMWMSAKAKAARERDVLSEKSATLVAQASRLSYEKTLR